MTTRRCCTWSCDEAAAELRAALAIDRAYANARNNLGNVLFAQNRFDDAIREFQKVVRLRPDSPLSLKNLAAAYAMAGQFDRAIDTVDAALRLNPAEPLAGEIRRQKTQYLQRQR